MRILLLQSYKFTKRSICCLTKTKYGKMIMKGLLSMYARTVFQKTNISNYLIHMEVVEKVLEICFTVLTDCVLVLSLVEETY